MSWRRAATGKRPRILAKHVPWAQVREDYLTVNLDPAREGPVTFGELAQRWGVPVSVLAARANREKWSEELQDRARVLAARTAEKTMERFAFDEAEIRNRQSIVAKALIAKASVRLQDLEPAGLSVKEMIAVLRLGMVEERKAVGMPELYSYVPPPVEHPEYQSPEQRIARAARMRQLADKLQRVMEGESSE